MESFAKAIYNQKNGRRRGRFANFFAEEILNISKSQLLRINSLEKLTDNVRQAIDDKKISETAAAEMSSMTEEKQEECLEKILTGEIKGTVQAIQNLKSSSKVEVEEQSEEKITDAVDEIEESSEIINSSLNVDQNLEKSTTLELIDVPEEFEDPQQEAKEWFYQEKLAAYEKIYNEAMRLSKEETDELKAAQWGIRASVARYDIEELKFRHKKDK